MNHRRAGGNHLLSLQQMSKSTLLFLGAGAILVFSSFYKKYEASGQLIYGIKSVKVESLDLFQTQLRVTVYITNPTSEPLEFNSFTANITAAGRFLAAVDSARSSNGIVRLNPGTTDLSFGVWLRNTDTIGVLFDLIKNKRAVVNIDGTIQVGALRLPVTKEIAIDLSTANYTVSGTNKKCREVGCTLI